MDCTKETADAYNNKWVKRDLEQLRKQTKCLQAELQQVKEENERLKELLRYAYDLPMNEAGDYDENIKWKEETEQALKDSGAAKPK